MNFQRNATTPTETNLLFVGADIGHGDTCLQQRMDGVSGEVVEEGLAIDGVSKSKEPSFPTLLARQSDQSVVIGPRAERSRNPIIKGFKGQPTKNPSWGSHRGHLIDFSRAIVKGAQPHLREKDPAKQRWIVGCPSGWSDEDVQIYTQTFQEAGFPNVRVERESRAAMIHARDEGLIDPKHLGGIGLVADFGSSTSDCTYVCALKSEPIDFPGGANLGAGLIEHVMLTVIRKDPQYENFHNYLNQNPQREANAALACRRLKEKYFRASPDDRKEGVAYKFEMADHDELLEANTGFMDQVLAQPIDALGGVTWEAALRTFLTDVKNKMGAKPDFIVLTGGASRMEFVREVTSAVFSDGTQKARISLDDTPETTIARGLARIGHWDQNCVKFAEEIRAELSVEALAKALAPKLRSVQVAYAVKTCGLFFDKWATQCIDEWAAGKIKGKDGLFEAVNNKGKAWEKTADAHKLRREIAQPLIDAVLLTLNPKIQKVCDRYRIPKNKALHFTPELGDFSYNQLLALVFDTVLGRALSKITGVLVDLAYPILSLGTWPIKQMVRATGWIEQQMLGFAGWLGGEGVDENSPEARKVAESIRASLLKQLDQQMESVRLWIR